MEFEQDKPIVDVKVTFVGFGDTDSSEAETKLKLFGKSTSSLFRSPSKTPIPNFTTTIFNTNSNIIIPVTNTTNIPNTNSNTIVPVTKTTTIPNTNRNIIIPVTNTTNIPNTNSNINIHVANTTNIPKTNSNINIPVANTTNIPNTNINIPVANTTNIPNTNTNIPNTNTSIPTVTENNNIPRDPRLGRNRGCYFKYPPIPDYFSLERQRLAASNDLESG